MYNLSSGAIVAGPTSAGSISVGPTSSGSIVAGGVVPGVVSTGAVLGLGAPALVAPALGAGKTSLLRYFQHMFQSLLF